jgi:hypothetical protein
MHIHTHTHTHTNLVVENSGRRSGCTEKSRTTPADIQKGSGLLKTQEGREAFLLLIQCREIDHLKDVFSTTLRFCVSENTVPVLFDVIGCDRM